jgi:Secretion system C-terminal sorting domain
MKKVTLFILFALAGLVTETSYAQYANTIELGIFNTPANSNTLEIRIRPTAAIPLNTMGVNYSAAVFTFRCLNSYGITAMNLTNTPYSYLSAAGGSGVPSGDDYTYFCFSMATPYNVLWANNQEVTIATIQFTATNLGAVFELVQTNPFGIVFKNYQEVYGQEAQGAFYHASTASALPVELLSFQANKKDATADLQWRSVKEYNLSFYGIERSIDGINFTNIGAEKPKAKNHDDTVMYRFIDEKPELGINYYRLQMVEQDNSSKYSKIVSVDFGEGIKGKSYPNPFTSELIIEMDIAKNMTGDVLIELFDISGKQVFARKVPTTGRKLTYTVPLEHLATGDYIVHIKNGKDRWQQKINKQ